MQFKTTFTEIKANDSNMISGHGSFFHNIDSHKDIVMPGAFTKTLKENKNRIKILWQHDSYEPIGKPINIYEDEKGLFFEAKISDTETGVKAMKLIKDGVLNELSIGYETVKQEWDNKRNVRLLKEIKLYEISVVTWASNELAQITNAKKVSNLLDEIKAGRMISSMNRTKIQSVIDALVALLGEDEPQEEPEEEMGCTPRKPKKSLEIDNVDSVYESILAELKKY